MPEEQPWQVRIRMYRKWLGDCFLLTFHKPDAERNILIDCGALTGTPGGAEKMRDAVSRIRAQTNAHLDAIVVTHEHWDHVSGFWDAGNEFAKFDQKGEVWAAWTEDPKNSAALERKKAAADQLTAIHFALQQWSQSGAEEDRQRGAAVADLLRFLPPGPEMAAFSERTDSAMKKALALGTPKYLSPGDVVQPAWLPGVRVYVLGPPNDIHSLHETTGDTTEMYGGRDAFAAARAAFAAAAGKAPGTSDPYAPFDAHLQWGESEWAAKWPELAASYGNRNEEQRRISGEWLNSAAELALQLDNYTNNTSLVLAFEIDGAPGVLLFVGDAQIGNWLSWKTVSFRAQPGEEPVSAADLLARTVFYKVGHHGSHNATLKTGGLEAMKSDALVAAIPVDEEFARKPKGANPNGWDMPAAPLLKALTERAKGRILRADSDFPQQARPPEPLSEQEWENFQGAVRVDPHFIDYFPGGAFQSLGEKPGDAKPAASGANR